MLLLCPRGQIERDTQSLLAKLTATKATVVAIGDDLAALGDAPNALAVSGGVPE